MSEFFLSQGDERFITERADLLTRSWIDREMVVAFGRRIGFAVSFEGVLVMGNDFDITFATMRFGKLGLNFNEVR